MSDGHNSLALDVEELEGQRDLLEMMLARIESANSEYLPGDMVHRLARGANPVAEYRAWRGMSLAELADRSGVPESDIASFEGGGVEPGLTTMARLARALRADLEILVPWSRE